MADRGMETGQQEPALQDHSYQMSLPFLRP